MSDALFPEGAVLVVGGSGGIGRSVCLEFAKAGTRRRADVSQEQGPAEEVAAQIKALGRKATVHQLTIGDAARVDAVVEEAAKAHERLHTVLVGAGTLAEQVPMAEMTREQWQTVIDQDLNGFYNVLQATLPKLRDWGGGSYVHLGSGGHLRWPEGDVMSVAPKAAIEALITGIAKEEGSTTSAPTRAARRDRGGDVPRAHETGRVRRELGARGPEEPGAQALGQARGDRLRCVFLASNRAGVRDRSADRGRGRLRLL